MKRRIIGAFIAAAAILTGVFVAPTAASADDNVPGKLQLDVVHQSDGTAIATLPYEWGVGDCFLHAGSTVKLTPPSGGRSTFTWKASGTTTKTKNGDIWHQVATFKTAAGTVVTYSGTLDSSKLYPNGDSSWTRSQSLGYVGAQSGNFYSISRVLLEARC